MIAKTLNPADILSLNRIYRRNAAAIPIRARADGYADGGAPLPCGGGCVDESGSFPAAMFDSAKLHAVCLQKRSGLLALHKPGRRSPAEWSGHV